MSGKISASGGPTSPQHVFSSVEIPQTNFAAPGNGRCPALGGGPPLPPGRRVLFFRPAAPPQRKLSPGCPRRSTAPPPRAATAPPLGVSDVPAPDIPAEVSSAPPPGASAQKSRFRKRPNIQGRGCLSREGARKQWNEIKCLLNTPFRSAWSNGLLSEKSSEAPSSPRGPSAETREIVAPPSWAQQGLSLTKMGLGKTTVRSRIQRRGRRRAAAPRNPQLSNKTDRLNPPPPSEPTCFFDKVLQFRFHVA